MFDAIGKTRAQIKFKYWLRPGQGQSLDEAIEQAEKAGNEILAVDEEKILVAEGPEHEVWGCRFCLDNGEIVIMDKEEELNAHAMEVHGWKP